MANKFCEHCHGSGNCVKLCCDGICGLCKGKGVVSSEIDQSKKIEELAKKESGKSKEVEDFRRKYGREW